MPLPRKVGPFTLMRQLAADAVAESYVAILDAPAGKQVIVRRILPLVYRDPARLQAVRTRIGDLQHVRPSAALAPILGIRDVDGELYVVEEQPEGVEFTAFLAAASARGEPIPHNVFLHLAAQLCNGLEAMHANAGIETGSEYVLHLALSPASVWVTPDGRITLGRYGLTRSPTALATQSTGTLPANIEYLSPEQTHLEQKLLPASDLFSLGALLYELLTFQPLFRAESNLQTIHRLRRAEVTTQLLEVKEVLPGLDKVLFRSLSLNPRHRYQRAFVLREDLRGLMAGFSFSDIEAAMRSFLEPTLAAIPAHAPVMDGSALGREFHGASSNAAKETTAALLRGVPDESLRDSPQSEPREFGPEAHPGERVDGEDGGDEDGDDAPEGEPDDSILGEDTAALLGGDTGTIGPEALGAGPFSRAAGEENRPLSREDTGWSPNARRALQQLDLPSRPLEPIDTARRTRDELEAPAPPQRRPLPGDLELIGAEGRGDTLPMAFETTRPSPDDGDTTGPSGWPAPVPPMGPPSHAPQPSLARRTPAPAPAREAVRPPLLDAPRDNPSTDRRPADLPPASGEVELDQPLHVPSDFAASLADDTGLHPLRQPGAGATIVPDLRVHEPTATREELDAQLGAPDSLTAPATTPAPAVAVARSVDVTARLAEEPQPEVEAPRSLVVPVVGLALVAGLVAAAVFLCVGGGGVLGVLGMRTGTEVSAVDRAGPPPDGVAPELTVVPAPLSAPEVPAPPPPEEPAPPRVAEAAPVAREPSPKQKALDLDLRPSAATPPRETFEAVAASPPRPRPAPPPAPPPPPPRPSPVEPVAALPAPQPTGPEPAPEAPAVADAAALDRWSPDAFAGRLAPDARSQLASVPSGSDDYTRAQTLLFLDAKARSDNSGRDRAMDALMAVPENRYNPALLVELAEINVQKRQWPAALEAARKAEQQWARLPSELVWSRKTMMYELQALAHTGQFYDSEGDDLTALDAAIRDWERYQRHVATRSRQELEARAEKNLARLREIRTRLDGGRP
jgi:serine/threonine protein kinase